MELWLNPHCSKCRVAVEELDAAGVSYTVRRYLDDPPDEATLRLRTASSPASRRPPLPLGEGGGKGAAPVQHASVHMQLVGANAAGPISYPCPTCSCRQATGCTSATRRKT